MKGIEFEEVDINEVDLHPDGSGANSVLEVHPTIPTGFDILSLAICEAVNNNTGESGKLVSWHGGEIRWVFTDPSTDVADDINVDVRVIYYRTG